MPTGLHQSSTSTSRLMQSQAATGTSTNLKLSTKGSKQMNQFRYGPVRAVQQSMSNSFTMGSVAQK